MSAPNLDQLKRQLVQQKTALRNRFEEIATLTELLEKEQAEIDALEAKITALEQPIESAGAMPFTLALTGEQREENKKYVDLIAGSDWFDAEWYLATYPDIAASEQFSAVPAEHYAMFGGFEGRKPCPAFDSSFYLSYHTDVANAGLNPLTHYLLFGLDEGRAYAPQVAGE